MPSTAAVPPARALPDWPPDRRVREGPTRTVRPVVGGGAGALPNCLPNPNRRVRDGAYWRPGARRTHRCRMPSARCGSGCMTTMVARWPGAGEHWGRVVPYPNAFHRCRAASAHPTPMDGFLSQCGLRRPGGHYADEAESVLTAMTPPSQCYHTVQALSHLRSGGIPLRTPLRLRNYPSTAAAGPAFQYKLRPVDPG